MVRITPTMMPRKKRMTLSLLWCVRRHRPRPTEETHGHNYGSRQTSDVTGLEFDPTYRPRHPFSRKATTLRCGRWTCVRPPRLGRADYSGSLESLRPSVGRGRD